MSAGTLPAIAAPDERSLLERLAPQVDDGMLREIAAADYGHGTDEHCLHLRRMIDDGVLPADGWYPLEVLELIRWSEPDQPGWRPGDEGRRGHLMRAFCSAWLLRIGGTPGMNFEGDGHATVLQLVLSLEQVHRGEEAIGSSWRFDGRWGLRASHDDFKRAEWQALGARLAGLGRSARSDALREWLRLIGDGLAEG
jgi:hypothetical protein